MNHPTYPSLSRRVRVQEIIRASTYRQHYFTDRRKPRSWRNWFASALLFVCLAVLFGEIARYVEINL